MASQEEIDASLAFPYAWQVRQEEVDHLHLDVLAALLPPAVRRAYTILADDPQLVTMNDENQEVCDCVN